ncbi:glycosyltransferase family 4 protein [Myxococcus llanfairpwllgwyngyllgogerychwyrndrobwllllantysiliogogogochensis]|uniref:Glycosyltransferase family 4 protein n=1 Tax=Myxococcus llanfairpwllgwyngyllgogerychwyrndrobwllllantysiliogogogochensis TaxID=2590453 RepID=A0A540WZV9_9BACT|nr:glycosyltransferase [Myxococcus llanfairpwllgwyngyllgogerychwyrndrobwllllantysiliogogogochensis]NTX14132.1 glycosyltransferase [Myxococcus sp. CA056]TQF14541.1 glycosyltransferase family 4 protein [Myxococcus llanfairpwllgwyngyllgogerychwyrndrobwllllantysiliogogogochensis]
MKVALVHDWLVTHRGGERVLDALCEVLPDADIYTLIHRPGSQSPAIEGRRIFTSFLQRIPGIHERYRHFLPLMPRAIESLRLQDDYDVVLSSSHCVAKGLRVPAGLPHLSYVHAPMRYMWDLFDDYFGPGRTRLPVRVAAHAVRPWLQRWDRASAERVDHFVANSHHVAGKLQRFWGRGATVVHPPVDLERFTRLPLEGGGQGGYFLWLGAFAPYKRLDIALEAFRALGAPLWVVGTGQEASRLGSTASSPHIRFLGNVSDDALPSLYRDARALIFTPEEDFGITPLEAQATGRPVIAFGKGGALETVNSRTGLFFSEQTPASLADAVRRFETWEVGFRAEDARSQAERFGRAVFQRAMLSEVESVLRVSRKSPRRVAAV